MTVIIIIVMVITMTMVIIIIIQMTIKTNNKSDNDDHYRHHNRHRQHCHYLHDPPPRWPPSPPALGNSLTRFPPLGRRINSARSLRSFRGTTLSTRNLRRMLHRMAFISSRENFCPAGGKEKADAEVAVLGSSENGTFGLAFGRKEGNPIITSIFVYKTIFMIIF